MTSAPHPTDQVAQASVEGRRISADTLRDGDFVHVRFAVSKTFGPASITVGQTVVGLRPLEIVHVEPRFNSEAE